MTLAEARRSDVIIALRMLGEPVTHDHGGPVRMYAASMYGYKSTKWLSGIELTHGRGARLLGTPGLRHRRHDPELAGDRHDDATTRRAPATLRRFGRAERAVHWTVAALMIVCIITAAILYNGRSRHPVGHRHAIELIHVYCGLRAAGADPARPPLPRPTAPTWAG